MFVKAALVLYPEKRSTQPNSTTKLQIYCSKDRFRPYSEARVRVRIPYPSRKFGIARTRYVYAPSFLKSTRTRSVYAPSFLKSTRTRYVYAPRFLKSTRTSYVYAPIHQIFFPYSFRQAWFLLYPYSVPVSVPNGTQDFERCFFLGIFI